MSTKAGKVRLPIRSLLIRRGLKPGTVKYVRAYERERWHRRSKESKRRCGLASHASVKRRMKSDPEFAKLQRVKLATQKRKYRAKNKGKVNEYKRRDYAKNRERRVQQINAARHRREPHRGIATLLKRAERGDVSVGEFRSILRGAVEQLAALAVRKDRKGIPERRGTNK